MKRSLNRARSGLAVLIAIACALAIVASSASAAETHEFRGEFNAPTLVEAGGLAVDDATGDVFVADQTTGEVLRYDANGSPSEVNGSGSNFFGAFAFSNGISGHPGGQVAVDNSSGAKSGTVYVATEQGVRAFTAEGEEVAFTGGGTDAEGNLLKSFEENPMAASSVAVDSEGDIYVFALSGVDIFDANGKALTSFQSENPNGIAVAPSGRLYPSSDFIERAVPGRVSIQIPETYPPQSASSYSFALGVGSSYGDAVDPRSEDVLVASANSVREYEPTGENASPGLALVSTFGEAELGAGSNGVAVNGTNGDVYVASGTHVVHYGPLVKAPNVVTGAATNVNSVTRTATLNGTVDPLGEAITECKFEYGPTIAYGESVGCAESPTGNGPVAVHADVAGLQVANYHFRLVAAGPEGSLAGADHGFPIAGPPAVEAESVEAGATEALFKAQLNSDNGKSTYYFEYGTTAAYGSNTASGTIPAAFSPRNVAIAAAGLLPGTTYHYRAVIANEVETTFGPDQTFTTPLSGGIGSCTNEALRIGFSALLPECRAYEMVSPVAKNGGEVYPIAGVEGVSSGEAVTFLSDTPFAGAPGNPLISSYISTRGADGWTTTSPDPPARNTNSILELSTLAFSPDLTETFQASTLALTPGAIEHGTNLYLRNNQTGHRQLVLAEEGEVNFTAITQDHTLYAGGSEDGGRIILASTIVLNGEGVEGAENIYEFADGTLSLIPGAEGGVGRPVSADGRRYFSLRNGALYVYEADGQTVLISASQRPGPEFGQPVGAVHPIAAVDGSKVDFIAPEGLAVGTGTPGSGVETLYSYDLETKALTQLVEGEAVGVLDASADDSFVYFSSPAVLAEGGQAVAGDATNLYVSHQGPNGSTIDHIATTSEGTHENLITFGQASPNGVHFGFDSLSALTSDDVPGASCAESSNTPTICQEVFAYDFATKHLSCVSCTSDPLGTSRLGGTFALPLQSRYLPRAVLDSGLVFFETPNSLSPRDSDGVGDVYEWNGATSQLISTGTAEAASIFADSADEGRDVFFKTIQPLVAQDVDNRTDLYDARVGGGIAAQNQTPASSSCEGETCRGASPLPPGFKSETASTCVHFKLAASRATKRAQALAKRAGKASGKRARKLRGRAMAARRQAKHLRKQNGKCGRQGR